MCVCWGGGGQSILKVPLPIQGGGERGGGGGAHGFLTWFEHVDGTTVG